jgi:2'-hydroxyisoflavone reductase
MKLLILGGTRFAGRFLAEGARDAGHEVTLFNRGESEPDGIPDVEEIHGDRDGGLAALGVEGGRRWDAVIDTSGFVPRVVRASVDLLAAAAGHYTFVSSMSVYPDDVPPGANEDAPLQTMPDQTVEEITGDTYGPLKVLCEREVQRAFPKASLMIRPGLIVGPRDRSDRFTYWPHRVSRGGEVLAPAPPERPVQFIDARDLAEWMLRLIEDAATGVFNAVGPVNPITIGDVLEACRRAAKGDAAFTWVPEEFLIEQGVEAWSEIPLVFYPSQQAPGIFEADISRPVAAGLTFRPLDVTVRDTLEWDGERPPGVEMNAGLSPEREAALLAAWHARDG